MIQKLEYQVLKRVVEPFFRTCSFPNQVVPFGDWALQEPPLSGEGTHNLISQGLFVDKAKLNGLHF
jgi:hypothetical protein